MARKTTFNEISANLLFGQTNYYLKPPALLVSVLFDSSETSSGQIILSGYGGLGNSVEPHSYAAIVTYNINMLYLSIGSIE